MINYLELSDEELNALVIEAQVRAGVFTTDERDVSGKDFTSDGWNWGPGKETQWYKTLEDGSRVKQIHHGNGHEIDYINGPGYGFRLMVEHEMSLFFNKEIGKWVAGINITPRQSTTVEHENPLWAVSVLYLVTQGLRDENEK